MNGAAIGGLARGGLGFGGGGDFRGRVIDGSQFQHRPSERAAAASLNWRAAASFAAGSITRATIMASPSLPGRDGGSSLSSLSFFSHYREIATTLWNEAQELGTDVIYLWDYWRRPAPVHPEEGHQLHERQPDLAYWNKGDYIPRPDLGTEQDFKQAIAEVHEKGGRVILYVEPFIIDVDSDVARVWKPAWAVHDFPNNCAPDQSWPKKQGEHLAGRFPVDPPLHVIAPPHEAGWCWKIYYPYYHTMVPDLAEWQAHLLEVVRR